MVQQITFIDETLSGDIIHSWDVEVATESMTLRELIMLRVEAEIKRRQAEHLRFFTKTAEALSDLERLLNPIRKVIPGARHESPDPEAHGYRALDAFQRNAFFVLIGDQQVDDLEEEVILRADQPVSFVRLTPLVGG